MRELKFRSWDGERMHYFDISDTISPSLEDNIMQFTGLTDKNGKEIWEGDLLKTPSGDIVEVWYEEKSAAFLYGKKENHWDEYLHNLRVSGSEVVGNIHENPGLIQ